MPTPAPPQPSALSLPPRPSSPPSPATLSEAIRKDLLGAAADRFSDVTLVSRDGARVPAVRALLGVRSAYFRARFFAGYADEAAKELAVPQVDAVALRDVVQFAYTDDSTLLKKAEAAVKMAKARATLAAGGNRSSRRRFAAETGMADVDRANVGIEAWEIVSLVDLVMAADYFQMASLASRGADMLVALVIAVPKVTCVVLEAAMRQPAVAMVTPEVVETARKVLRRAPQECLLVDDFRMALKRVKGQDFGGQTVQKKGFVDSGVLMLRADTLESVLKDDDLFTSETYLLQVLYYWATDGLCLGALRGKKYVKEDVGGKREEGKKEGEKKEGDVKKKKTSLGKRKASEMSVSTENAAGKEEESRWEQAKRLVRHINLERLKPSFVRDYLEPSGLVDREGILSVYQQQALEAERGRALYDSFRGGSVWHNGTKTLTEESNGEYRSRVLGSPWVRGGRHEWTFRIDKESDCTWIGVASAYPDEKQFFGNNKTGWAYATQGTCTQSGRMQRRIGPSIEEGQTVKMILNLTRGGTLTMVAEGNSKSFKAFSDLIKNGGKQYVPVVYLKRPGCITLVSEKHTMD